MPPHWPFSRSLLYPLTAVLVVVAVVPVGMLGWGFVTSNREQVATLEKQYLTRQSVGLASEIELRFLGSVGRLRTAAEILRSGAKGPLDGEAASALLRDLAAGSPSTVLLRLLDDAGKGTFLQGAGLSDEALRRLEPRLGNVFTATLQGEPVNELIERLPSVGSVILVSLPVRDAQDEVVGVLQGVVALQDIASLLVQDSGLGVTVDVVDHQGMVLFSSDRNRVGY